MSDVGTATSPLAVPYWSPSPFASNGLIRDVIRELRTKPRPLGPSDARTIGACLEEAAYRRLSV